MNENEQKPIKLSEEDIDIIVERVCAKIENNLYHNVGHGVVQLATKGIIIVLILLAAYGAGVKGWFN